MPAELWANGWVTNLTAKSLITYLIIRNHSREAEGVIRIPKIRASQYALKPDHWAHGVNQLKEVKLIKVITINNGSPLTRIGFELNDKTLGQMAPAR